MQQASEPRVHATDKPLHPISLPIAPTVPVKTTTVEMPEGEKWNEAAALVPRQVAYSDMVAAIRLNELDDFVKQRQEWSRILKVCILFILIYVTGITIGAGRGWLVFQQAYLLQLVFISCFASLYGLVRILLHFLYAAPPKNSE
jgi:hypothetical protein